MRKIAAYEWYQELLPILVILATFISYPIIRLVDMIDKRLTVKYATLVTLSGPILLMMAIAISFWHYSIMNSAPRNAPFTVTGAVVCETSSYYPGWRDFHLTKKWFATITIKPKKGFIVKSYGAGITSRDNMKVLPMGQYYIGPDPTLPKAARPQEAVDIYVP